MQASREAGTARDNADAPAGLFLRAPRPEDGPSVTALIRRSPPLDVNSAYCNLLQCAHFADTCVVAERGGEVVGWLSAHRPPSTPHEIFVWQIAVDPGQRGMGLARRMLDALLERTRVAPSAGAAPVELTATITEDNAASWGLFASLARDLGCALRKAPLFTRETHFAGAHDTEWRIAIGPLWRNSR
jgi:L-2,4-diaminobutyric acid acetyltransferase